MSIYFSFLVKITGGSSMASVKINELETKIYELERQNAQLKEKVNSGYFIYLTNAMIFVY